MRDERFASLTHPLRQRVLIALVEHEEPLRIPDELVERDEDPTSLAQLLYHVHLPMLTGAGYVEWTPGEGTIVRGNRFEEVAPLLPFVSGD